MRKNKTRSMILIALMSVIMAVSAWITIPFVIPFTLQTFAVFLTMKILGGKRGTVSILIYMLMAAVGIPVLSGFQGGFGALLGPTGGYITGFLAIGILYWLVKPFNKSRMCDNIVLGAGLVICYVLGTIWFVFSTDQVEVKGSFLQAMTICVFPYIIPDVIKLLLADFVSGRVKKVLREVEQ